MTVKEICDESGMGLRQVYRWLKALEDEKLIGEIVPDSKDRIQLFQTSERLPFTQEHTRNEKLHLQSQ